MPDGVLNLNRMIKKLVVTRDLSHGDECSMSLLNVAMDTSWTRPREGCAEILYLEIKAVSPPKKLGGLTYTSLGMGCEVGPSM